VQKLEQLFVACGMGLYVRLRPCVFGFFFSVCTCCVLSMPLYPLRPTSNGLANFNIFCLQCQMVVELISRRGKKLFFGHAMQPCIL
jgi:hypothetical protein